MKKVTAFVGTPSKKHTHYAVGRFLEGLRSFGDVEPETVVLSDYRLETCRGCKLCFVRGEAACPLKDDRDVLVGKMEASDGVVFATPNLSFQVSASMKLLLDRLGYVFHRPRFFGRTFTSIVAQGIYGGQKIVRYLDFAARGLGFNTVKGIYFTAFEPMTAAEKRKIDGRLDRQGSRFHDRLLGPAYPVPNALWVAGFHMARTSIGLELDDTSCDWRYYRDQGWFGSDYYYPTRVGPFKKAVGRLAGSFQTGRTKRRLSSPKTSLTRRSS
jgi:multimeric flavodoxin WrbA